MKEGTFNQFYRNKKDNRKIPQAIVVPTILTA